ncbi:MAG: hypothetical protein ACLQM6_10595 [Acidobacteriaceae bacterium]
MFSVQIIKLIETRAESLTHEVVADLLTNEHTTSYRRIPKEEVAQRALAFYQNLGNWIGDPKDDAIRAEYEKWGAIRCRQGIPVSEIVYSLMLRKKHLRRCIREYGSVESSGQRIASGEPLPLALYNIQELNYLVVDFFDRALYYIMRGYEMQAKAKPSAAAR